MKTLLVVLVLVSSAKGECKIFFQEPCFFGFTPFSCFYAQLYLYPVVFHSYICKVLHKMFNLLA